MFNKNNFGPNKIKPAIIPGTRPEIIKQIPIIRECKQWRLDHNIPNASQHYSFEMERVYFDELNLPAVRYDPDVGSGI